MDLALWVTQGLLAFGFGLAGWGHAITPAQSKARVESLRRLPDRTLRAIGALELLGAVGVILPAATKVGPRLTPLAAAALSLMMVFAAIFHLSKGESAKAIIGNLVLLALGLVVAIGRTLVVPL